MGKDTYWAINKAQIKDEELDAIVDRIVSGLFSVVVTMGKAAPLKRAGHDAQFYTRCYTHHPLSERWSCGNDLGKA